MPVIDGAIDWFVFRRGAFDKIPPFKLGRYVWDSWMVDFATRSDWNSVTSFSYDRGDQVAFGLHWEVCLFLFVCSFVLNTFEQQHSRKHQAAKQRGQGDRDANRRIADRFGGGLGDFGRLRGMELMLTKPCSRTQFCVKRRFDSEVLPKKLQQRARQRNKM
jgi:hypothetical protein